MNESTSTVVVDEEEVLAGLLAQLDDLLADDMFATQDGDAALALRAINW